MKFCKLGAGQGRAELLQTTNPKPLERHSLLDYGEARVLDGLPRSLVDTQTGGAPIKGLV